MRLYNFFTFFVTVLQISYAKDKKVVVFIDVPQGNLDIKNPSLPNQLKEFTVSGADTTESIAGIFSGIPPYLLSDITQLPEDNLHSIFNTTAHFGEWPFKNVMHNTEYKVTKNPYQMEQDILDYAATHDEYLITIIMPLLSPLYFQDDHPALTISWQNQLIDCYQKNKVSRINCYLEPHNTLMQINESIQRRIFEYFRRNDANIFRIPVHGALDHHIDAWYTNENSNMRGTHGSLYFGNIMPNAHYYLVSAAITYPGHPNGIDILPTVAALLKISDYCRYVNDYNANLLLPAPRKKTLRWQTNIQPMGSCKDASPKYAEQIVDPKGNEYIYYYDESRSDEIYPFISGNQEETVQLGFSPQKSFIPTGTVKGCSPNTNDDIIRKPKPDVKKDKPSVLLMLGDDISGISDVINMGSFATNIQHIIQTSLQVRDLQTETICSPTRASLLTGMHTPVRGAYRHTINGDSKVAPSNPRAYTSWYFLSSFFASLNYTTAFFGKRHWDDPRSKLTMTDYHFNDDTSKCHSCHNPAKFVYDWTDPDYANNSSAIIAADAIAAIERANGEPLFLYASFSNMHSPFDLSEKQLYEAGFGLDKYPTYSGIRTDRFPSRPGIKYTATFKLMDDAIGNLVNKFDQVYKDNWILIYVPGDNGREVRNMFHYAFGLIMGRGGKRSNFDTDGTMFIRYGDTLRGTTNIPATIPDIFVTLAGLFGYKPNNLPTYYRNDGRIFSARNKEFSGVDLSDCFYDGNECEKHYARIRRRESVAPSQVECKYPDYLEIAPRFMVDWYLQEQKNNHLRCYADSTQKRLSKKEKAYTLFQCYNLTADHLQTKQLTVTNELRQEFFTHLFAWPNYIANKRFYPKSIPAHNPCNSGNSNSNHKRRKRKRRGLAEDEVYLQEARNDSKSPTYKML